MVGFLVGIILATAYWIALIIWGVFIQVAGDTWVGWRARVPDILWFTISALLLGFLVGWERAVTLAGIGAVMSIAAMAFQAFTLWREGENQSGLLR